jgi:D-glycero-D-manno-heptose 1,7-bisphosphate phosphatase
MSAALFLDRDGVINEKAPEGAYVTDWGGFRFLPGVLEALAAVRSRLPQVRVVVVTNQRAVALATATRADVDALHVRMTAEVRAAGGHIDAVEVCLHGIGECDCRKPALGLFRLAMAALPGIDLASSVMVGDSLIDMQAGNGLGVHTALVGEPSARATVRREAETRGVRVEVQGDSLAALVADGRILTWLGGTSGPGRGAGGMPDAMPVAEGSAR